MSCSESNSQCVKMRTSNTGKECSSSQIIVIKVGTSSLVRPEHNSLNLSNLARICETIKVLQTEGHRVIVVSSGAVGVGCQRLGVARPSNIAKKQALAAVGQVHLMRFYEDLFHALGMTCAQVLLTYENLGDRGQYINARNTFTELLRFPTVVPVVNENKPPTNVWVLQPDIDNPKDTVAVQELRFGDNDTLSAQVATLVKADWLFLLTDVDCLYTANPKHDPNAQPIYEVEDISKLMVDTSTAGTQWGTGGMATKITAARIATAAGCTMVICSSSDPENIAKVLKGERIGTKFHPLPHVARGRKRWILSVAVRGQLWLDDGALRAVRDKRKSLFSPGISKVVGEFNPQEAVAICDGSGVEVARGLCNYSSEEVARIRGKRSTAMLAELQYHASEEVVHRDNLVLLMPGGTEPLDGDALEDDDLLHATMSPRAPRVSIDLAQQLGGVGLGSTSADAGNRQQAETDHSSESMAAAVLVPAGASQ